MVTGTAIDLFAGAGGTTTGLSLAGYDVRLAIECDRDAAETLSANFPETKVVPELIESYSPRRILREAGVRKGELDILSACPPCQGFSTLGKGDASDPRNDYVAAVGALAVALRPRAVLLENVPGLQRDTRLEQLEILLRGAGYGVGSWRLDASEFCVPQHRRRFILIAVAGHNDEEVLDPRTTYKCDGRSKHPHTVRDVIESLGPPGRDDPLHQARTLPRSVLERVKAIPHDGGSRAALPNPCA